MYVLVFTLMTTGQIAFYSGDIHNRQRGRPTVFQTQALCQQVRDVQVMKMEADRAARPDLPPYTLECLTLEAAKGKESGPEVKKGTTA